MEWIDRLFNWKLSLSLCPSAYGKEGVKMNFVDRIFVGELTNTIMCEECEHVSGYVLWAKKKKKHNLKGFNPASVFVIFLQTYLF